MRRKLQEAHRALDEAHAAVVEASGLVVAYCTARRLLADAHVLRVNGERPPGAPSAPAAETWRDWDRRCEEFLRSASPGRPS